MKRFKCDGTGDTNDIVTPFISEEHKTLTEKEKAFFEFYNNKDNWRPPTYRRCAEALGYKDTKSIYQFLNQNK